MTQNVELGSLTLSQGFKVTGAADGDSSGLSVSGAGDINGDGRPDFIIGAYLSDADEEKVGTSYVIFGKTNNTDINLATTNLYNTGQGFSIIGSQSGGRTGNSVSSAGDINGDGYDDLLVGGYNFDYGGTDSGVTYVIFGNSSNLTDIDLTQDLVVSGRGFSIFGATSHDQSGESVSDAGDINGDGYDDIIIGARVAGSISGMGASYIIFGKASGFLNIDLANDLTITGDGFSVLGASTSTDYPDHLGDAVSGAGDINNDGYNDIIIGATGVNLSGKSKAGTTYVIFGKATGFSNIDMATTDLVATNQGFAILGAATGDQLGSAVSSAGDINGDGYDDIIIGAPDADRLGQPNAGCTYIIYGKENNFTNIDLSTLDNTQGFAITGITQDDNSGRSVSAVDINNDGYSDILIGAPKVHSGIDNMGRTYVIYGKSTNFYNTHLSDFYNNLGFYITGASKDDYSGYSVNNIGDLNGDGYDDIIIGAYGVDSSTGASYIIYGGPKEPTVSPTVIPTILPTVTIMPTSPTPAPTYKTISNIELASLTSSQGISITGTGANFRSGYSVSDAGDVNGDGYTDIIVGEPFANKEAGIAYVIFGSSSPSNIDLTNLSINQGFSIFGTFSYDQSGFSVSSAGDINGDGYDDLIIGANEADGQGRTRSGTTYIIFGKSNGFSNIDLVHLPLNQGFSIYGATSEDQSGESVSNAGDINGDGYDDIIIGAKIAGSLSGMGASYIIFGKASGFTNMDMATTDLVATNQGFSILGATSSDNLGDAVSGAGDINNDGYDDIIIGATGIDLSGKSNAGTTYVIFGKASGFTNIDMATTDLAATNQGFAILGAAASDNLGNAVSIAGDVNGDGYDDIIIGAANADRNGIYNNGISYVIFGKSANFTDVDLSSMNNTQGFSITGESQNDYSGRSVSAADINNDGYSDIIIGVPYVDNNANHGPGITYVVLGKSNNFTNIDLGSFDNSQGFYIRGNGDEYSGYSVSGVKDFNGDGYEDLIVGASYSDNDSGTDSGTSYVIYGGPEETPFPTSQPSGSPTSVPSDHPSCLPSAQPSSVPTSVPSGQPSTIPSAKPSSVPTSIPSGQPTSIPSAQPSAQPSSVPTNEPSIDEIINNEDANQSNFIENNMAMFVGIIIGGAAILTASYCIYAKTIHAWPFNSEEHPDSELEIKNVEIGSAVFIGDAGIHHDDI